MTGNEVSSTGKFLSGLTHSPVVVKLNNGVEYHGLLNSIDGFMNIVLEDSEEFVDNVKIKDYGEVFLRGNNVLYISQI